MPGEGDGEQTSGLVAFILLSFITCGIYAYYWYYKLGNRLAANAHSLQFKFPGKWYDRIDVVHFWRFSVWYRTVFCNAHFD